MADTPGLDRPSIESWLSAPRYRRYLETANDDDRLALDLYLWNVELAQAVLRDVSFFEVALRNAYDRAISNTWSGDEHWLFDAASPVRRPILRTNKRGQINDANRLNRNAIDHLRSNLDRSASPDKVISNLTLGFWSHMTDRNHERELWIPSIHHAWPKGASRDNLNRRISEINNLRNRAAHHEHLFSAKGTGCSTKRACVDAAKLFEQLVPEAYDYVYGKGEGGVGARIGCSVADYLNANPAPCGVAV